MRLNRSIINLLICFIPLLPVTVYGQYKLHNKRAIHFKSQYAGGIGFISVGVGCSSKNEKLETDFFYGYVPESAGGITIHALSTKLAYFPLKPLYLHNVQVKPVSVGLLVNYTFGRQYFGFSPDNYPFEYYKRPTSWHAGLLVGGQINRQMRKKSPVDKIGVYYELVSYDTEILSYINNKTLNLTDILSLGLGIKVLF